MFILIGLIGSVVLQVIAAASALWLLKASRARLAWILMFAAFIFMAVRRVAEIIVVTNSSLEPAMQDWMHWLGIVVSGIMAVSVIMIGRALYVVRNSEEARKESESRFTALFHHSSDEIYLADLKGNFLEVNQTACETLGYSREEFLRMNYKDIKTPKYYHKVDENLQKIIAYGRHVYETEHVARDGRVVTLEVKSRLIDYQGRQAIFSIARETTERRMMERKILGAVIKAEENERERVSREIHDGLGPLLSTIRLYVNELESGELEPEEKGEILGQTNELIDEAITNSRAISNNLTPRVIIDFGLVQGLHSFCKKVNLAQKINIDYESRFEDRLDPIAEMVLYRVVTELINNTLKHAGATKVGILLEKMDDNLQLTYMDNGIGFDKEKALSSVEGGMGLKNIVSRLRSINANLRLHTSPGKGLLVVIEVPLEKSLSTFDSQELSEV